MPELTIRPYQPGDRAGLLRVAADTAFFGAPVEAYLQDRRLMCDLVYRYFTDYEPEHTWIAATAAAADGVAGFLAGCIDTTWHDRVFARRILPAVLARLLCGHYRLGPRTRRFAAAAVAAGLRREYPEVDLARYPAHLHINLSEAARGHGAGKRLMVAHLDQLRALGVRGVHLRTTSRNAAAVGLYARLGFRLLDARPTTMWQSFLAEPVENRCYGLTLT